MFRPSNLSVLRKLLDNGIHRPRCLRTCAPSNQTEEALAQYSPQEPLPGLGRSYLKCFPALYHPVSNINISQFLPDHVEPYPTKITKLPNGLKIATQDSPGPAACIGLFVDSGSIYESEKSMGVTHVLERMAFKSTKNRNHLRIVHEIEATGGNVGVSASREQMAYSYDTLKTYFHEAVELLVDCIRNPLFLDTEVKEQLAEVKIEAREFANNPQQFVFEALNTAAYSGALGNPLMASESALDRIDHSIIEKFYHENYTAERMVLAASGVDHDQLLSIAKPLLFDIAKGPPMEEPRSVYVGGDFRHRADSNKTHVALAFEVPGGWRQDKDATALAVLQTLMGGGGSFSTGGPGKGMHSRLYLRVLNGHREVDSFSAFSSIYNETGLFGIHSTTGSDFVAEAVWIAADELIAIATPGQITDLEFYRAKNATKAAVLMNLESRMIVTEDIGRQILTYGSRKPVEYFLQSLEELRVNDLVAIAQKILSSPLTMASWGDVDRVPSYDSISRYFQAAN